MIRVRCHLKEEGNKVEEILKDLGFDVHFGEDSGRFQYEIVIIENNFQSLVSIKNADPRSEVIVLGRDNREAIEAVKLGAFAYFTHPLDADSFRRSLYDIAGAFDTRRKTEELEQQLYENYTFAGSVIGKSEKMLSVFSFVRRIAPYFHVVLVTGETGTGKEVIARALHELSTPGEPFVICNCGGLTESLVESVLFGHKKGSFTGAISDRKGLFESAGAGCIFLDEIGELPLSFQTHFLRVLQDGEFRHLGGEKTMKARCRIIAATNRDLEDEVRRGQFRKDLFFRLTPLSLKLPPLRERKEDIHLIARECLKQFNVRTQKKVSGISLPAREALMGYDWPGNVRELFNVVDQAAIMSTGAFIRVEDLAIHKTGPKVNSLNPVGSLEDAVKAHVQAVLDQHQGNRSHAAKALGISRRALLRKIEKYRLR